ncbi:hypothetical protein [Burkholderia sp. BCC1640]|uniref:hypothetical protein n=1 Tax=Burkholderia sp. BCC1640 TaxID=2676294 RepID=UPI00158F05DE|nr:hypothetical protein [Burkholderia sp. BCC1640]
MVIVGERGSGRAFRMRHARHGSHAARGWPSCSCGVANNLDAGARRALRGGAVMQPRSAPVVGALHGVDLFVGLIVGQIPAYRPHLPCIAMALSNLDAALAGGKRIVHDPHSGPGDKRREL